MKTIVRCTLCGQRLTLKGNAFEAIKCLKDHLAVCSGNTYAKPNRS